MRFKLITLNPDHWNVRRLAVGPLRAARWFKEHEGERYDWQPILGFVAWWILQQAQRWTCSEAAAAALGVPEDGAWRFGPGHLHEAAGAWM